MSCLLSNQSKGNGQLNSGLTRQSGPRSGGVFGPLNAGAIVSCQIGVDPLHAAGLPRSLPWSQSRAGRHAKRHRRNQKVQVWRHTSTNQTLHHQQTGNVVFNASFRCQKTFCMRKRQKRSLVEDLGIEPKTFVT